ncbi:unnamed protein product [Meganyctiphanes norvegica]|uniref:Glycosyltransferase family 92 protein n=1 Tax=Meganyctiphanes norvegica TaxID=48144 RepID=A0AAV2RKL2_MEGNR
MTMKLLRRLSMLICLQICLFFVIRQNLRIVKESDTIYDAATVSMKQNLHQDTSYVDKKTYYSKLKELNESIPNEILDQVNFHKIIKSLTNSTSNCGRLPMLKDIQFNNLYWQELELANSSKEFLYRAYYDNRTLNTDKPSIRIISVLHTNIISRIKYCQIWFPDRLIRSQVTSIIFDRMPETMIKKTCIITCNIPKVYKSLIPKGVSVLENECDNPATNLLKVNHHLPENGIKEGVAVCAKAFDFSDQDKSIYFIQWLELFDILGFSKVFLYDYNSHPTLKRVLEYYQSLDRIELIPLTVPGPHPNQYGLMLPYLLQNGGVKQLHDKVAWNDCYYRNINKYKYISIQDTDEIIIPTDGKSIQETFDFVKSNLLNTSQNSLFNAPSGYEFNGATFTEELLQLNGNNPNIPTYMSLLQSVYRRGITKFIKTVLSSEHIVTISTHSPHHCFGTCTLVTVPIEQAYIHHYRKGEREAMHTDHVINDTSIWSHKEELLIRVQKALDANNIIPV